MPLNIFFKSWTATRKQRNINRLTLAEQTKFKYKKDSYFICLAVMYRCQKMTYIPDVKFEKRNLTQTNFYSQWFCYILNQTNFLSVFSFSIKYLPLHMFIDLYGMSLWSNNNWVIYLT